VHGGCDQSGENSYTSIAASDPAFAFVGGLPYTALDFSCGFCIVIVITFNTLTSTFDIDADE
jgi:hypothetical protein